MPLIDARPITSLHESFTGQSHWSELLAERKRRRIRCRTSLTYETDRRPEEIDITTGSLDHPEDFPPTKDVYPEERLPWVDLIHSSVLIHRARLTRCTAAAHMMP
jgi:Uncharacterized conserved protein